MVIFEANLIGTSIIFERKQKSIFICMMREFYCYCCDYTTEDLISFYELRGGEPRSYLANYYNLEKMSEVKTKIMPCCFVSFQISKIKFRKVSQRKITPSVE